MYIFHIKLLETANQLIITETLFYQSGSNYHIPFNKFIISAAYSPEYAALFNHITFDPCKFKITTATLAGGESGDKATS